MNSLRALAPVLLLLLPLAALADNRTYAVAPFEAVSVAQGVQVHVTQGGTPAVVASGRTGDFDDLRIVVDGTVLRIDRPRRGWFSFRRQDYVVNVVAPVLRSVVASSGSEVDVKGVSAGDFSVEASSGSDVRIEGIRGGAIKARATSGSDLVLAGSCSTLEASASSGSDLDAGGLACGSAKVQASSGSDLSVSASGGVSGVASSGSDVVVRGGARSVQVEKSSGADVTVNP